MQALDSEAPPPSAKTTGTPSGAERSSEKDSVGLLSRRTIETARQSVDVAIVPLPLKKTVDTGKLGPQPKL